ncbi:MAG: carotenoid biosynthesis protein [Halobacteriaceae archaeon]
MVRAVFVTNLVLSLLGVGLCLAHAVPDRERVALLGTGVVYGVILEQLVILHFDAYRYPVEEYILTVADVPVVIGLGWAAILYSGLHAGRRLGVPARALPPFVGLFALHIDLAIDAVAIRVPFWTWASPGAWFGVPLGNFMGWFLVGTLFPAAWLGLRRLGPLARGPVAVVAAVAGIVAGLELWSALTPTVAHKAAVLGAVAAVAAAVVLRERAGRPRAPDRLPAAIPLLYHGYYLSLVLALGMYREQPLLLAVSVAMLAVGVALHRGVTAGG